MIKVFVDSGSVTFPSDGMGLVNVDLNNISPDNNFDDYDPEININVRPMAWCDRYKQRKAC